jgi:serine protease Do
MKRYFFLPLLALMFVMPPALQAQEGGIESLRQTGKAFASVARKVSPSVVFIQVESIEETRGSSGFTSPFSDELFRHFFGDSFPGFGGERQRGQRKRKVGQGSGFVFSLDDGISDERAYILTNNHVIDGADRITVTFEDGRELEAAVKGTDPQSDIAVLEVEARDVSALGLGDSDRLEVGEWVVAIGNPFGLSHTLTAGVVSAKGRTSLGINDYEDFIQTDAAINPGNSGGALINAVGDVVAINTAIFSQSGGSLGIGFAIPIQLAEEVMAQLIENGRVIRGWLGISGQDLTAALAESMGIDFREGILVSGVLEGGPGDLAGLKPGDLIVKIDRKPVTSAQQMLARIASRHPGSPLSLTVSRDGTELEQVAIVGERPRLAGR